MKILLLRFPRAFSIRFRTWKVCMIFFYSLSLTVTGQKSCRQQNFRDFLQFIQRSSSFSNFVSYARFERCSDCCRQLDSNPLMFIEDGLFADLQSLQYLFVSTLLVVDVRYILVLDIFSVILDKCPIGNPLSIGLALYLLVTVTDRWRWAGLLPWLQMRLPAWATSKICIRFDGFFFFFFFFLSQSLTFTLALILTLTHSL